MYFQVKQYVYWDKNVERKLILSIGDWLVIENVSLWHDCRGRLKKLTKQKLFYTRLKINTNNNLN